MCRERRSRPRIKYDNVSAASQSHFVDAFCACVESTVAARKYDNNQVIAGQPVCKKRFAHV